MDVTCKNRANAFNAKVYTKKYFFSKILTGKSSITLSPRCYSVNNAKWTLRRGGGALRSSPWISLPPSAETRSRQIASSSSIDCFSCGRRSSLTLHYNGYLFTQLKISTGSSDYCCSLISEIKLYSTLLGCSLSLHYCLTRLLCINYILI